VFVLGGRGITFYALANVESQTRRWLKFEKIAKEKKVLYRSESEGREVEVVQAGEFVR
jgi:hypothetical protein